MPGHPSSGHHHGNAGFRPRRTYVFCGIEGAPRRRRWPLPGSMPVPFTSTGEPVNLSIEDEGIRLAPTPVTAQSRNEIAEASRTPRERLGDLKAQEAANLTGVRRLEALLELRRDDVSGYNAALLAFGRLQAQALVRTFPRDCLKRKNSSRTTGTDFPPQSGSS